MLAEILGEIHHDVTHIVLAVGIGNISPSVTVQLTHLNIVRNIELIVTVPIIV